MIKAAVLVIAFFLLQACEPIASVPEGGVSNVEVLAARAASYWEKRKAGDLMAAARYLDPQKANAVAVRRKGAKGPMPAAELVAYRITDVRVEGDEGTVSTHTRVKFTHPLLKSQPDREDSIVERWVKRDGEWFRSPRRITLDELFQEMLRKKGGGKGS